MESQERDVSPSERLAELLKMRPSKARSPDKALSICGELVDLGSELGEVAGLRASLEWARDLESWEIPDVTRARLYYFQGNACLAIDELNHRNQTSVWNWDREEIEYAIIALRRACRAVGFQALPGYQRSAFLTNLANTMDTVGRFVASSMTYVQAMDSDPTFGMPMANRSISLWHCTTPLRSWPPTASPLARELADDRRDEVTTRSRYRRDFRRPLTALPANRGFRLP